MAPLGRRRFLALGLSTAAASMAGCSRPGSTTDGPFTWLPAQDGGIATAYIDFTLSDDEAHINPVLPLIAPSNAQSDRDDALAATLSNVEDITDPLLTFPLKAGGLTLGNAVLAMATIGLGTLVDPARPTDGVTELLFASGVTVGMGDIDTSDVDERLQSGPEQTRFEVVGEDGDYTLYGGLPEDDKFAAVGDSTVVLAESRSQVEAALDAHRGDREHVVDADNTFASLLDETNLGHVLVGWEAPVDLAQFSIGDRSIGSTASFVSADDDVVSSVTFDPGNGEIATDLAISSATGVDEARLDERLGSVSADRSLSIDGDRVIASGRYTESTVNINFVADETTTAPPTVSGAEDLPEAVAEAVPGDGFEFTFIANEEVVAVELVGEFGTADLSIRAVESESEFTLSVPTSIESVNVPVDPDGDIVVVEATVDGESGVVARYDVS